MLPVMKAEELVGEILNSISEFRRMNNRDPQILRLGKAEHTLLKQYAEDMIAGYTAGEGVSRFAGLEVVIPISLHGYEVV